MKTFSLRKTLALLTALPTALLICSCRNQINVNGESYDMLTERETVELVLFARKTLVRNSPLAKKSRRPPDEPTLLSAEEAQAVRSTEPDLQIDYRGDCSGEAVVTWDLPQRKIEVVIQGQLNETNPFKRDLMVRIMKKYGPVLDMRKGEGAPPPKP